MAILSPDEADLLKSFAAIGLSDVTIYHDYRWRNIRTGEVQEVLHPRLETEDWVRERRRGVRIRGDWEEIS